MKTNNKLQGNPVNNATWILKTTDSTVNGGTERELAKARRIGVRIVLYGRTNSFHKKEKLGYTRVLHFVTQ